MAKRLKAVQIENCKLKIANLGTGVARRATDFVVNCCDVERHLKCLLAAAGSKGASSICNLQFSIFNFQFLLLLFALCSLLFALDASASAQTVSDKIVASVTNGSQTIPDLITYSDLVWHLALEPGRTALQPTSKELDEALKTLEDQLLILQEARKLPLAETNEAQKEFEKTVQNRRDELAKLFGTRAHLEERMSRVGLTTEQVNAILRDRVTIERYVAFRFRAFALVSAKEISDRYEKQYGRLRNTGRIVPTLDQARDQIEHDLTEEKIAEEIDKFVDSLRDQPSTEIVVLNPV